MIIPVYYDFKDDADLEVDEMSLRLPVNIEDSDGYKPRITEQTDSEEAYHEHLSMPAAKLFLANFVGFSDSCFGIYTLIQLTL
jgi:hypothetical protein